MSYLFFEDVLRELQYKLMYDAISNYAGNGFCKDSWEMITDSNPFNVDEDGKMTKSSSNKMAAFFSKSKIKMSDNKKGKGSEDKNGTVKK